MAAGLRLVTPEGLQSQEADAAKKAVIAEDAASSVLTTNLVAFIDGQFEEMVRHRDGASGWTDRLTSAMRVFTGQYDSNKLAEIRRFGGSEIYARLIATKCRGATSLLRDVYLNTEKPWGLQATPDPTLPDDMFSAVQQLIQVEVGNMVRLGEQPGPAEIRDRVTALMAAAKRAAIKKARAEAETAFNKLDDILVEGLFYEALAEML